MGAVIINAWQLLSVGATLPGPRTCWVSAQPLHVPGAPLRALPHPSWGDNNSEAGSLWHGGFQECFSVLESQERFAYLVQMMGTGWLRAPRQKNPR